MTIEQQERTVKELLEELRARRWSDADIGREIGVTYVAVWRWRKGKQHPPMEKLVKRALMELLERP